MAIKGEVKDIGGGKLVLVVSIGHFRGSYSKCLQLLSQRKVDEVWLTNRRTITHKIVAADGESENRLPVGSIEL
jgi:hypothetical protein